MMCAGTAVGQAVTGGGACGLATTETRTGARKRRRQMTAAAAAAAAAGAGLGLTGAAPEAIAADSRPNIVFITTDDMRVRDLTVMPNVRNLVTSQGLSFTTSIASYPLCCPARASWVTGQYNHNNGVMGNASGTAPEGGYAALDASSTVATWLRAAGYQTAFVGKYLNGYGSVKPVVVPPGWQEWHAAVGGGDYFTTKLRENTGGVLATRTYAGTYQVDLYDSIATEIISRRAPSAAPFFLWVSQYAPHSGTPVEADDPTLATPAVPARWKNHYATAPLPTDPSFNEANVSDKPSYIRNKRLISAAMQAQMREANSQRWESLRAVDESVAHIIGALRASGELGNTVVVFSSDNGFMLGEHRIHTGKTVPYEASSQVPLIMRGPGFPAGATRSQPVVNVDVAPTFAALAEATPTLEVDGVSLLPLASDPGGWPSRTLVVQAGPKTRGGPDLYHGVRTTRYKYIEHSTGEVEFYDLLNDPNELTSLTNNPAHDATQAQLRQILLRYESCAGMTCRN